MSTFLQLCQDFVKEYGISESGPSSVTGQTGMLADVVNWIAKSELIVQRKYLNWPHNETDKIITLSDGTNEYSLTDMSITDMGIWREDSFFINPGTVNYRTLTKMDYDEWFSGDYRLGVVTEDEPTRFIIKPGMALAFATTPDTTYTVWAKYFKVNTKMAANTTESTIPSQFHQIIIYRAAMFYAQYMGFPPGVYEESEKNYNIEMSLLEAHSFPEMQQLHTMSSTWDDPKVEVI